MKRFSLVCFLVMTRPGKTCRLRVDHPLIEQLWRNIVWTQRSNFVAVPTDCPNRAERMAYFADASIFWDASCFNMDLAAYARRQMENVRDHPDRCSAATRARTGRIPYGTLRVRQRRARSLATAYWVYSADLLSRMAEVPGKAADAKRLREIYQQVRNAFIERYVDAHVTCRPSSDQ